MPQIPLLELSDLLVPLPLPFLRWMPSFTSVIGDALLKLVMVLMSAPVVDHCAISLVLSRVIGSEHHGLVVEVVVVDVVLGLDFGHLAALAHLLDGLAGIAFYLLLLRPHFRPAPERWQDFTSHSPRLLLLLQTLLELPLRLLT